MCFGEVVMPLYPEEMELCILGDFKRLIVMN